MVCLINLKNKQTVALACKKKQLIADLAHVAFSNNTFL